MPQTQASLFLGVPHPQLNTYIQHLTRYQRRLSYGHSPRLPDIPSFAPDTCRRDSLLSTIDTEIGNWSGTPQPPSPHKDAGLQKASMLAREYAAYVVQDTLGDTVQRTEAGDPLTMKTYGWRVVDSESLVLNPHRIGRVASARDGGKGVTIVYRGMGDNHGTCRFNGVSSSVLAVGRRNPHRALADSAWACRGDNGGSKGKTRRHDPKACMCRGKTKRLLVCAMLDGDPKRLVPIRIETVLWRPNGGEQIKAYAEFARRCVQ